MHAGALGSRTLAHTAPRWESHRHTRGHGNNPRSCTTKGCRGAITSALPRLRNADCGQGRDGEMERGREREREKQRERVPLGHSTVGGFTISDQLGLKSGFRGGGGAEQTAATGSKVIREFG